MDVLKNLFEKGIARWLIILVIVVWSINTAITDFGWYSYVQSWGGAIFKAMSGAGLGWLFSRYVVKLDISKLPPEQWPAAGLSLAIYIAAFVIAVSTGS